MTEETFVRVLERRADDVQPRHLGFDDVRAAAHRIRRRRRVAASAAAAAVVAGVLIAPGLVGGGSPRGKDPDPAPPAPSGRTAYLHDGQVTLADGRTVEVDLDDRDVTQFGVLSDGRIVAATSRPQAIQVLSPSGDPVARHQVPINAIKMSADDTLVAWTDEDHRVVVLEAGVTEPITFQWGIPMPGEGFGSIDAVYGSDCAHDGCTVLGGDFSTTTTTLSRRAGPGTDLETSEPLQVTDVSPDGDLWAVSFPPADGDQFGCSGIYEVETGQVLARNCDTSGLRFAPDGQHLLGMRGDNGMFGRVEVYDRDLQQLRVYDPEGGRVVKAAAWEDGSHLLVVTAGLDTRPEWSLVRVPIDGGSPQTLVGPVDGPHPEAGTAFLLSD